MLWKIIYGDGSTFSSEDGEWKDAPSRNALILLTADDFVGREIWSGADNHLAFLWWPGYDLPMGADAIGLWDFLYEIGHSEQNKPLASMNLDLVAEAGVKFGRTVSNETWRKLYGQAISDKEMPAKSARYPHEPEA